MSDVRVMCYAENRDDDPSYLAFLRVKRERDELLAALKETIWAVEWEAGEYMGSVHTPGILQRARALVARIDVEQRVDSAELPRDE